MKKIIVLPLLIIVFVLMIVVFSQSMIQASTQTVAATKSPQVMVAASKCYVTEFGKICNLSEYLEKVYRYALILGAALAILMCIYGGYRMVTSSGNPESITEAKSIIIGAISGLVLLLFAWIILNSLNLI